jgi:Uma2 family endonuclease
MNDNLIIIGINAPRKHQAIIAQLIYGLTDLYRQSKTRLFAYPETMIDEGQTSPVPDVMLVDVDTDLTKAIIEITHTQGVKKDAEKLQTLMSDYDVQEGFVYDYKKGTWRKFDLDKGEIKENPSFCAAIGHDLSTYLF